MHFAPPHACAGKEGRTERKSQKSRKVPQKSPSGATVHVLHQAHPKQTHTPGEGQELITHAARTHAKHAAQAQIVRMSPEQKLEFQEQTRRAVRVRRAIAWCVEVVSLVLLPFELVR